MYVIYAIITGKMHVAYDRLHGMQQSLKENSFRYLIFYIDIKWIQERLDPWRINLNNYIILDYLIRLAINIQIMILFRPL